MTIEEAIKFIVNKNDSNLLTDSAKFKAHLGDLCSDNPKELKIINRALDDKILEKIFGNERDNVKIARLRDEFEDQGMTADWIDFIISSFAQALGWNYSNSPQSNIQPIKYIEVELNNTVLEQLGYKIIDSDNYYSYQSYNKSVDRICYTNDNQNIYDIYDTIINFSQELENYRYRTTHCSISDQKENNLYTIANAFIKANPNICIKINTNIMNTQDICCNKTYDFYDSSTLKQSIHKNRNYYYESDRNKIIRDIQNQTQKVSIRKKIIKNISSLNIANLPQGSTINYNNLPNVNSIDIPETFTYNGENYKITKIGNNAFKGLCELENIKLPDTITEIGAFAFSCCTSLKTINIPNKISKIKNDTFNNCFSLAQITIPDTVTEIGERAFKNCTSLKSIDIPNGVTEIKESTFISCSSLENVTIPITVTKIRSEAFQDCSSLKTITIPNSVISIGSMAFMDCKSLNSITIPDSVNKIGEYAFALCSSLKNINIPKMITKIEEETFSDCLSLTQITIPNIVNKIGKRAFYNCSSLESLDVPKNVKEIEEFAFYNVDKVYYDGVDSDQYNWGSVRFYRY